MWLQGEGFYLARATGAQRTVTCPRCRGRRFEPEALTAREQQLLAAGALPDHERSPCVGCQGRGSVWEAAPDAVTTVGVDPGALVEKYKNATRGTTA